MKKLIFISLLLFHVSSFAANKEKAHLLFKEVPLSELATLIYTQVFESDFILSSEVTKDQRLLTLSVQVDVDKFKQVWLSFLENEGYTIQKKNGVDFIIKKEKQPEEKKAAWVYYPKYRSPEYIKTVLSPFYKDLTISNDKTALLYAEIEPSRHESLNKTVAMLDVSISQVQVRVAVYAFQNDEREASAINVAASILSDSFNLKADVGSQNVGIQRLTFGIKNFDAVISGLSADSRFKVISRPTVIVKDAGTAKFISGDETPVLSKVDIDKNGNPVQSVEYKPSGIILNVSPKIQGELIELDINQQISSFSKTQTGVNATPTLIKREATTQMIVKSGDVSMLAGLIDSKQNSEENRLPFLGWKLGQSNDKSESEVLILVEAIKL